MALRLRTPSSSRLITCEASTPKGARVTSASAPPRRRAQRTRAVLQCAASSHDKGPVGLPTTPEKPAAGPLPLKSRDVGDTLDVDPFTPVSSFCSTTLVAASPTTPLREVVPLFQRFTGLPVVDSSGCPVGVVSDKDVSAYLQKGGELALETPVSSVMSAPAITILDKSPLAYAAGKMLQFKARCRQQHANLAHELTRDGLCRCTGLWSWTVKARQLQC